MREGGATTACLRGGFLNHDTLRMGGTFCTPTCILPKRNLEVSSVLEKSSLACVKERVVEARNSFDIASNHHKAPHSKTCMLFLWSHGRAVSPPIRGASALHRPSLCTVHIHTQYPHAFVSRPLLSAIAQHRRKQKYRQPPTFRPVVPYCTPCPLTLYREPLLCCAVENKAPCRLPPAHSTLLCEKSATPLVVAPHSLPRKLRSKIRRSVKTTHSLSSPT